MNGRGDVWILIWRIEKNYFCDQHYLTIFFTKLYFEFSCQLVKDYFARLRLNLLAFSKMMKKSSGILTNTTYNW